MLIPLIFSSLIALLSLHLTAPFIPNQYPVISIAFEGKEAKGKEMER